MRYQRAQAGQRRPRACRRRRLYKDGLKNGTGIYTWAGGDIYEGDFVNDIRSGNGVYTWANGERYEGEFENNLPSGYGTYYWPSGRTYTGFFENGVFVRAKTGN